jgi:hypothetical protein
MFGTHESPDSFIPALKPRYLEIVADMGRRARDSAARQRKKHLGDQLSTIGKLAYDRTCNAIERAVRDGLYPWLGCEWMDSHFVILISGYPIRFYPGHADLPIPSRALKRGAREQRAHELVFEGMESAVAIDYMRFEVERNERAFTEQINFVFVGADGARLNSWTIPRYVVAELADAPDGSVKLPPKRFDDDEPDAGVGAVVR